MCKCPWTPLKPQSRVRFYWYLKSKRHIRLLCLCVSAESHWFLTKIRWKKRPCFIRERGIKCWTLKRKKSGWRREKEARGGLGRCNDISAFIVLFSLFTRFHVARSFLSTSSTSFNFSPQIFSLHPVNVPFPPSSLLLIFAPSLSFVFYFFFL